MNRFAAVPLLLLLPLIWQAGDGLARRALKDARYAGYLAPGLGFSAWLLSIHVLGLVTHSFYVGLFGGSVLIAACGGAFLWLDAPEGLERVRPPIWLWVGMALMVLLLLAPEWSYSIHDEDLVVGHLSMPAEIQNGIYPPRHLAFPQFELRYHYAVDLAAAVFSTLLGRLDMVVSVHGLALLLWAFSFCVLWVLGETWIPGRGGGLFTGSSVLLAGGFNLLCRSWKPFGSMLLGECGPTGLRIVPPLISNFLQHPWSLAIPVAGLILIVFHDRHKREFWDGMGWWLFTLGILFCVLALSEVALFVCLLPALVVAGCFPAERVGFRQMTARMLPFGVLVVFLVRHLHGFFAQVAEPSGGFDLYFHSTWIEDDPKEAARWFAEAFGFALPLGLVGFRFLKSERLLLGFLVAGSLLVRSTLAYRHSWDIVKFAMVTQIFLAILSAATITALWQRRRTRPWGALALALTSVFAVGWVVPFVFKMPENWYLKQARFPISAADRQAIAFLRDRVAAGESVFRNHDEHAYAVEGGLPEGSWDWGTESFGFSQSLFDARDALYKHPSANLDDYVKQTFRWFVIQFDDREMRMNAEAWKQKGLVETVAQFPPLTIYHVTR